MVMAPARMAYDHISKNISVIKELIARAATRAGRKADDITLIAVSKFFHPDEIRAAYECGQRIFGESYAQELKAKSQELSDLDIEWHFVGHLQKNKAKFVTPISSYIQSIDSIELAETIDRRASNSIDCLIEVNLAQESSKSGIDPSAVIALAEGISAFKNIKLKGLMTIPPYDNNPESSRKYFIALRNLLDKTNESLKLDQPLLELSMGMSTDFEVAISEGATMVRIGTSIFGERK